jgi:hypothetical protein
MFASEAVPFRTDRTTNRRYLTEMQLAQDQYLAEFVAQFRDCFEHDELWRVFIFIEAA